MMQRTTLKKGLAGAGLLTAILGGAVWQDTAAYRAAMQATDPAAFANLQAPMLADMGRARQCGTLHDAAYAPRPEMRACYLSAMRETQSNVGAYALATYAVNWLEEHPDDTAMREAALDSLAAGRAYLLTIKPQYDAADRVDFAHNTSVLRTVLYGSSDMHDRFARSADDLDKMEVALRMPALSRQQAAWRRRAFVRS